MANPIYVPGLTTVGAALPAELESAVRDAIEEALETTPTRLPQYRIGPDLTFVVPYDDGSSRTFDLVADGQLLRDPVTRQLWRFHQGKNMLRALASARGLAPPPATRMKSERRLR
jgi:hypothetical protein